MSKEQNNHSAQYLTHQEIVPILVGLMMGLFLAALDQTIVATSIRTIGDQLNGLSLQAWVTTAYLITSTITTPLYGKLSDIYGRKPLFIWAISLFIAGSALSAFSSSMGMLAVFRAVQELVLVVCSPWHLQSSATLFRRVNVLNTRLTSLRFLVHLACSDLLLVDS